MSKKQSKRVQDQDAIESPATDLPTKAPAVTGRCYTTHLPLKVGAYVIYGGSCSSPVVQDADIYIGFDMSMRKGPGYPWSPSSSTEVLFYIPDMGVPSSLVEFRKMVEWVAVQLTAGKKIHAGCIGGHGRTGTFLAALVGHMTGNKDAIEYVRANYCTKAVESDAQVEFLHVNFGLNKAKPTKQAYSYSSWREDPKFTKAHGYTAPTKPAVRPSSAGSLNLPAVSPMLRSPYRIWGSNCNLTNSQKLV